MAVPAKYKAQIARMKANSASKAGSVSHGLAALAGAGAAGVLDAKMGPGTTPAIGVAVAAAGLFVLKSPMAVDFGAGMLATTVHDLARDQTNKMWPNKA